MQLPKKLKDVLFIRLPNWLGFLAYGILVLVSLIAIYTIYLFLKSIW